MKRPSAETMLFGHPVIALPIMLGGVFVIYLCALNLDAWPLGLGGLIAAGGSANASERRSKYRAWQRAWDGMTPAKPPFPVPPQKLIAGGIVGLAVLYAALHLNDPLYLLALGWLIIGGLIAAVMLLARRRRTAQGYSADYVQIAVGRPVIAVPSLKDAYLALPEHCWAVL